MLNKITLLIILLGIFIPVGFSQPVIFHLTRHTICDPKGKSDSSFFYIKDSSGHAYEYIAGVAVLPAPGHYRIYTSADFSFQILPEVIVPDQTSYTHHFYEKKIEKIEAIGPHDSDTYLSCSEPINGYLEDFYPNGKIRIRGNFIDGRVKDSIINFYPNGNVINRKEYLNKGIHYKEYDSVGNLLQEKFTAFHPSYPKKGYEISYFSSGNIYRRKIIKKNKMILQEYYPNGKLKFKKEEILE